MFSEYVKNHPPCVLAFVGSMSVALAPTLGNPEEQ
jgi:hypothetical protein